MNGVARFNPTETFRILIKHFGKHPRNITEGKVVGHAKPHQKSMTEWNFSLAETGGLVNKKDAKKGEGRENFEEPNISQTDKPRKSSYLKKKVNNKELDTLNRHLKEYMEG